MRVEPFDAPAKRYDILRILNTMDRVEIGEKEVYCWPRFHIDVLAEPDNLAKFVTVIDRLAGDTHPAVELMNV
jgi:hypothetical protein